MDGEEAQVVAAMGILSDFFDKNGAGAELAHDPPPPSSTTTTSASSTTSGQEGDLRAPPTQSFKVAAFVCSSPSGAFLPLNSQPRPPNPQHSGTSPPR